MDSCYFCDGKANTIKYVKFLGEFVLICNECYDKMWHQDIEAELEKVKNTEDFQRWNMNDMSEAFWTHLAKYQKTPNRYSLSVMKKALHWASHEGHGLSNSFNNALKWCKIDIYKEAKRDDLPDK